MKSEQVDQLAAALSKAQAEIRGAIKDANNPFFKSKYADLESVWDACRVPLSKNGLAVVQAPEIEERGTALVTTLLHSSGQWIESRYPVNPVKNDPQGLGAAVTYARRYALAAIVGVCSIEDDDGETAMNRPKPPPRPHVVKPPEKPITEGGINDPEGYGRPHPDANEPAKTVPPTAPQSRPTEKQLKRLFAIKNEKGWSNMALKSLLKARYEVDSTRDLTWPQYDDVCKTMLENPMKEGMPMPPPDADDSDFAAPDEAFPFEGK